MTILIPADLAPAAPGPSGRVQHASKYAPTYEFRMDRHLTTMHEFSHTQELACPYDPFTVLARHIQVAQGTRESVRTQIAMDNTGTICADCHMQIPSGQGTCPDC